MRSGPDAAPFTVIIPARFASTRLPAKALADIAGKPMVVRVADQARASGATAVWIATDHDGIEAAAREHGIDVIRSRREHASGTDRIAEAVAIAGLDDDAVVVNVQGDEPQMPPAIIGAVAHQLMLRPAASIATACHPIHAVGDFLNPNVVKAVLDADGYAMAFSRAPVPWPRDRIDAIRAMPGNAALPAGFPALRHLGIYAYRVAFLARYAGLAPAPIEQWEALEQLRAMWHGYRIAVTVIEAAPPAGVDTPSDLERVRAAFAANGG